MLDKAGILALGTDFPAEGISPFLTFYAAYSNFEEGEKGSIEVGKFADFTVYSENLMEVPIDVVSSINAE